MKKFCKECGNLIEENFEFCPFCGEAITEKAEKLEEQKSINANLILIANLMDKIEDRKTLKILNEFATKLAQK